MGREENEVTQSCPTLCNPIDCSLPGSSVHGIFQAGVLEWGAIAFSVYSRDGQLNTYMDNGDQVSRCSGNTVTNMERGENRIKHAVLD